MVISEKRIAEWRAGASQVWATRFPVNAPRGWSVSPVDPTPMVDVFSSLWLRQGMALRAYQYRWGRDGHGVVYALPAGQPLPPVDADVEDPPHPAAALGHVMEAIDGDGSLESYVQASILWRELRAFGGYGHGASWGLCHVLGSEVWADPPLPSVSPNQSRPSGLPYLWAWSGPQPDDYRPTAVRENGTVRVVFYVYSALGQERIDCNEDVFQVGSYAMQTDQRTIATNRSGYRI